MARWFILGLTLIGFMSVEALFPIKRLDIEEIQKLDRIGSRLTNEKGFKDKMVQVKKMLGDTMKTIGNTIEALQQVNDLQEKVVEPLKLQEIVVEPQTEEISSNAKKPWFCHKLDCPEFIVEKKTKDYELRKYKESNWVSTEETTMDYGAAVKEMFERLFAYIQGKNVKKEKIAMTAPVIIRIIPGQGPACKNNFTMSFFLPHPAPKPSDNKVKLTRLPGLEAFVRSFGGYHMRDFKPWGLEAEKLAEAINSTAEYHTNFYYTAGYDSPFRPFHRHNEVWFIKK